MSVRGRLGSITGRLRGAVTPGRVSGAITAGQVAGGIAGIVGGGLALMSAAELYNNREAMAGQFQQNLTFPEDLVQNDRDLYMSFNFQAYEKRSITEAGFLRPEAKIRLPIPNNLKDSMTVSYENASLTPAVGAALEQASKSVGEGAVSRTIDIGLGAAAGAATGTADRLLGEGGKGLQAYFGVAVNPYQTVLFKNPEFKSHTFSWRFAPKNEAESGVVRDIARTFQYHMSPGIDPGYGLFFSYPSMVQVSLWPSSEFLYRFKPSVVKSVTLDYAPGSSPSFFKRTKAPTAIILSVQMQEIEYWTNNDFSGERFAQG